MVKTLIGAALLASAASLPAQSAGSGSPVFARPDSPGLPGRGHGRRGGGTYVWVDRGEYQGDTAFRSEGFNDWWHERADRNTPRWVQQNGACRQYWAGGGWRC